MSAQPYHYAEQPAAATQRSAGRGLWISGIVVAAVGVVLAIVSAILLFSGVASALGDQLTAPILDSQGTNVLSFDRGSYVLFQEAGAAPITPQDVHVVGSDGSSLPVTGTSLDEQFDRAGAVFVSVARFDVPQNGVYTLQVARSELGTRIVVAHGLTDEVAGKAGWGLGILGGGLLVIVGLVLFAVGLSRRRRSRTDPAWAGAAGGYQGYQPTPAAYQPTPAAYQPTPAAYQPAAYGVPAGPPPGWYPDPDPSRPGGRRYWDGSAWTGHIT